MGQLPFSPLQFFLVFHTTTIEFYISRKTAGIQYSRQPQLSMRPSNHSAIRFELGLQPRFRPRLPPSRSSLAEGETGYRESSESVESFGIRSVVRGSRIQDPVGSNPLSATEITGMGGVRKW